MEKRALVLALALMLPLALYGIPYAYATTVSSGYVNLRVTNNVTEAEVFCNPGDYATGGGGFATQAVNLSHSVLKGGGFFVNGTRPDGWIFGTLVSSSTLVVHVNCQTPITVAGIGVPQFGSLYVAIALGAVVYFMMASRFARRPTLSAQA
jgi:hypothetical protein